MMNPWIRPGRPLLIAHRGLRARIPEHTRPSLEAAIAGGAEMIEADALLTQDDVLVLMHDATVDRTTDGHGRVADLTWAQVASLDAGAWFDPAFAGLRVLTVGDLIDIAREAGVGLCLEAKGETRAEAGRVAEALAMLVAERAATSWAFVSSFDHAALARARALVPELLLAPERLPEHGVQPARVAADQALGLRAPVIQHRWELIDREVVDTLHEHGVAVWAWNTNDPASISTTLALGVDGIVGDDVDLLAAGRRELEDRPEGEETP